MCLTDNIYMLPCSLGSVRIKKNLRLLTDREYNLSPSHTYTLEQEVGDEKPP